jgi:hypothetical protein
MVKLLLIIVKTFFIQSVYSHYFPYHVNQPPFSMRKEIVIWLLLLMFSFGFLACQYQRLDPDQLPEAARNYLMQTHPDAEIRRVKRE